MALVPWTDLARFRVHGKIRGARAVAIAVILAAAVSAAAARDTAQDKTQLLVPADAQRFDVTADSFKVNGLPSRITGFLSPQSPAELARWYRQKMGEPVAENRLGNRQILGKEQDGHYITVQLEPLADGTRGVVSIASLKDSQRNHEVELAARERWQNRLPAGSRLLSHIGSVDAGQAATFIAFVNRHDETLNQDTLKRLMREEGLELERAAGSGPETKTVAADSRPKSGTTMYFKGNGREAVATIFRSADAQTAVVLNITTAMRSGQ